MKCEIKMDAKKQERKNTDSKENRRRVEDGAYTDEWLQVCSKNEIC